MSRRLRREEYTVGWICALPVELAAAQEMLDEEHEDLKRDDNDENLYSLGSVTGHNVVIVCLPAGRIGNNPAAAVATQMRATFNGIRFGLMVGIGAGVPGTEVDIRLGDVVISQPQQTFGGVIQYDFGKATPSGFERTGSLNSPPQILLGAVARVRANELRGRSKLSEHVSKLDSISKFQRGKAGPDVLFEPTYDHEGGQTCDGCNTDRQLARQPRESEGVVVHYGTIASGNQVMRNGRMRNRVSRELGGILCFEMEAAGLMNSFPCLVIRGICDYADSHKNKRWQPYAAAMAAACAKEILSNIPVVEKAKIRTREPTKLLQQEEAKLLDLKLRLHQHELPPQILWQKPVVLNDARGRSFPFFLELIDSAELFVEILKSKFKDIGLRKVQRGEWLLQDHYNGRILDLKKPWGALIRPGQTLDMSMIFRKQNVSFTHCPYCRSKNNGPPETQTRCSICGFVYQRVEEIQEIAVRENDFQASLGPAAHQTPKTGQRLPAPSPRPRPLKPQDDEDDISHYTRVQFINTKFRVQKGEASNVVPVLAMLRPQDLENIERLSEYLATCCDLSQEECQAALKDCNAQFLAMRAEMDMEDASDGYDGDGYDSDGYDSDGYDDAMDGWSEYYGLEGSYMMQRYLGHGIPREAVYGPRRIMIHSEARNSRSYSHSIVSDICTDGTDTVEEEDEEGLDEDSSMNDFIDDGKEDQGPIPRGQGKRGQTRILDRANGSRGPTGPPSSTSTDASGEQELDEDTQALLRADGWMLQHDGDDDSDDDSDGGRTTVGWDATAISNDRVRSPTPIRPPSRVGNPGFMDGSRGPRRISSIISNSTVDYEDGEADDDSDLGQNGDFTKAMYALRQRRSRSQSRAVISPSMPTTSGAENGNRADCATSVGSTSDASSIVTPGTSTLSPQPSLNAISQAQAAAAIDIVDRLPSRVTAQPSSAAGRRNSAEFSPVYPVFPHSNIGLNVRSRVLQSQRLGNPWVAFVEQPHGIKRNPRPRLRDQSSTATLRAANSRENIDLDVRSRVLQSQESGNPWVAFVEQPHGTKRRNSRPRLRDQSSTATLRAANSRENIRDGINPPQGIESQASRIDLRSQPPVAVGTGVAGQPAPHPTQFTPDERESLARDLFSNRMRALGGTHQAVTSPVRTNPFAPGIRLPNPSSDVPLTNVTVSQNVRSNSNKSANLGVSSTDVQAVPSSPVLGR